MMEHAKLPSSLTDGRQKSSRVRVGGYHLRLNTGDFTSVQARGKSAFKASMATLSLMRTRIMDVRNSPAAVNVYVLYNAQPVQFHGQNSPVDVRVLLRNPQAFSLLGLERLLRSLALGAMPRSRGVPQRGGRSGIRASLSHLDLQQAVPIASVPPSSPLSDQERFVPNGSHQSFRLIFQSRLIRPVVTVNFTVYISEGEGDTPSSTSLASTSAQESRILLGDMNGLVYRADCLYEEALVHEEPPPSKPAREEDKISEPSQHGFGCLHLVTDSRGEPILDDDGYVTWLASPSPEKEDKQASPSHAV